jgi:hypothetical protein
LSNLRLAEPLCERARCAIGRHLIVLHALRGRDEREKPRVATGRGPKRQVFVAGVDGCSPPQRTEPVERSPENSPPAPEGQPRLSHMPVPTVAKNPVITT